jgi:hypothetical protein
MTFNNSIFKNQKRLIVLGITPSSKKVIKIWIKIQNVKPSQTASKIKWTMIFRFKKISNKQVASAPYLDSI